MGISSVTSNLIQYGLAFGLRIGWIRGDEPLTGNPGWWCVFDKWTRVTTSMLSCNRRVHLRNDHQEDHAPSDIEACEMQRMNQAWH